MVGSSLNPAEAARARLGELVDGKYELIGLLGAGGMGAVYDAHHRFTDRRVALKLLHKEHSVSERSVLRFLQEARAVAQIEHPSIVLVLDAGQDTDGAMYVAFERLEGESFSERLERGPIGVRELVDLTLQLLGVLKLAHDRGMVHRDIKPDNLFCVHDGDRTILKLMDFGIARQITGQTGDLLTAQGMLIGTPHFMSPEQVVADPIDGRTDIWAVGVVMYFALSRRFPHEAESMHDVLHHIAARPCPSLRTHRDDLPLELIEAVDRALEHDVDRRWPSADAFARALQPFASRAARPTRRSSIPAPRRSRAPSRPTKPPATGDKPAWEAAAEAMEAETRRLRASEPPPKAPRRPSFLSGLLKKKS